jgi:hypothetical protein
MRQSRRADQKAATCLGSLQSTVTAHQAACCDTSLSLLASFEEVSYGG